MRRLTKFIAATLLCVVTACSRATSPETSFNDSSADGAILLGLEYASNTRPYVTLISAYEASTKRLTKPSILAYSHERESKAFVGMPNGRAYRLFVAPPGEYVIVSITNDDLVRDRYAVCLRNKAPHFRVEAGKISYIGDFLAVPERRLFAGRGFDDRTVDTFIKTLPNVKSIPVRTQVDTVAFDSGTTLLGGEACRGWYLD